MNEQPSREYINPYSTKNLAVSALSLITLYTTINFIVELTPKNLREIKFALPLSCITLCMLIIIIVYRLYIIHFGNRHDSSRTTQSNYSKHVYRYRRLVDITSLVLMIKMIIFYYSKRKVLRGIGFKELRGYVLAMVRTENENSYVVNYFLNSCNCISSCILQSILISFMVKRAIMQRVVNALKRQIINEEANVKSNSIVEI